MRAKNVAIAGFVLHIAAAFFLIFLGIYSNLQSLIFLCLLISGGGFIWVLLFVHIRQEFLARAEGQEIKDLSDKKPAGSRLFEDGSFESFSAQMRLSQMEKWFFPAASLLIAMYMTAIPILKFTNAIRLHEVVSQKGTLISGLGAAAIAFILFVFGKYAGGLGSVREWRLLRIGGALSVFCAIFSLVAACGAVMVHMGLPKVELFISYLIAITSGVLGIELAVNFILYLYKPKISSEEYHPPYESRLLTMLAKPTGAFETAAEALDYQFGFKISQTWFYRFIERAIAPLILFQIIAFYGLTCMVVVGPQEEAILERFGIPIEEPLEPGFHFKSPWPIEKVYKYPVRKIEMLSIGKGGHHKHEHKHEHGNVILWTKAHGHGEHYLIVASKEGSLETGKELEFVPVNLLNASVVLYYRISDLGDFLYLNADTVKVLESIASRELVRFVVSMDLFDIMGSGRLKASENLTVKISEACRKAKLGIEVLYVDFLNVHPPVSVAAAFEEVVGAIEEQHSSILSAEAYENRIVPLAKFQEVVLETNAQAYKFRRGLVASATAEQFKDQNEADRTLSKVYRIRKFLAVLEEGLKNTRKYVVPENPNAEQVIIVDVKEKLRPDLLDIDLTGTEEEQ